jgi:hypothetical protein
VASLTALVTLAGYLALLGWDQDGLYQSWQVVLLVILLAALAAWAAARNAMWSGTVAAAVVMTVAFGIDAETDVENDGLWPIGAAMVLVTTFGGFVLVGTVVEAIRRRKWTRRNVRTLG